MEEMINQLTYREYRNGYAEIYKKITAFNAVIIIFRRF